MSRPDLHIVVEPYAPFHTRALRDNALRLRELYLASGMSSADASIHYSAELQQTTGRSCDGCTMCCHLIPVQAMDKKAGERCVECKPGVGCAIYDARPDQCRGFLCNWAHGEGPEEMKPTSSHVVFDFLPDLQIVRCNVHPSHPDAWKRDPVRAHLRMLHAIGTSVQIIVQNGREPPPAWGIPGHGKGNIDMYHPETNELWCRFRLEHLP